MTMNANEIRSRGYAIQREIPEGSTVVLLADVTRRRPVDGNWDNLETVTVHAGEPVQVTYYTNAGFRGIEASLRLTDGTLVHGVEAGLLDRW